jgi:hypothetical protein
MRPVVSGLHLVQQGATDAVGDLVVPHLGHDKVLVTAETTWGQAHGVVGRLLLWAWNTGQAWADVTELGGVLAGGLGHQLSWLEGGHKGGHWADQLVQDGEQQGDNDGMDNHLPDLHL